jgi:tetratricopeptide (TPR) repeat protein
MLASANPYANRGPNVTVREVLDAAARRIEGSFNDQPLVEAALHATLFETYDALGLSSEAQFHAQSALALRRKSLPPDHLDIAVSLHHCASAAAKMAQYAQAEALARESLDNCQKHFGLRNRTVAESLMTLGTALVAQGKFPDAEPVFRESAKQHQELYGTKHTVTIRATNRHACCLLELGRLDEAEPLLEQGVVLGREALGPDHPELANMLSSFGELLHLNGNFEAAESAYRESLAIRRIAFGDDHITIANSFNVLAFLLVDEERFEEAEPLNLQSLEMRRRLYGPRRIEVTFALNGLARLYLRTERPVEAEALLRESLGIFDEAHPTHWRRAYAECLLGAALTMQGRYDDAEPLLLEGVAGVRAARGDRDRFTQEVLQYAADFYDRVGRIEEGAVYARILNGE